MSRARRLRPRSSGEVSVLGVDPADGTREWRDRIGIVLQESAPDPGLTVREALELLKPGTSNRVVRSEFINFEPVPVAVDLDGDGIEEVIVPQNQMEGHIGIVFRGPAGYRFQSVNSGFEGVITALGAIPGENPPTIIASVVRFDNILKGSGETQIIMTLGE